MTKKAKEQNKELSKEFLNVLDGMVGGMFECEKLEHWKELWNWIQENYIPRSEVGGTIEEFFKVCCEASDGSLDSRVDRYLLDDILKHLKQNK